MKLVIQKRTYAIIAVLLLIAAMSLAATKPEDEGKIVEAFAVDYEMSSFTQEV